jgi:hypothetical protein
MNSKLRRSAILAVFILAGCTKTDQTQANIENLLKKNAPDATITELSQTVDKEIGGARYQVAKAEIRAKNRFGVQITEVLGYVFDLSEDSYYTMSLDTFDQFLKTGDKSGFPKIRKPLTVDETEPASNTK